MATQQGLPSHTPPKPTQHTVNHLSICTHHSVYHMHIATHQDLLPHQHPSNTQLITCTRDSVPYILMTTHQDLPPPIHTPPTPNTPTPHPPNTQVITYAHVHTPHQHPPNIQLITYIHVYTPQYLPCTHMTMATHQGSPNTHNIPHTFQHKQHRFYQSHTHHPCHDTKTITYSIPMHRHYSVYHVHSYTWPAPHTHPQDPLHATHGLSITHTYNHPANRVHLSHTRTSPFGAMCLPRERDLPSIAYPAFSICMKRVVDGRIVPWVPVGGVGVAPWHWKGE